MTEIKNEGREKNFQVWNSSLEFSLMIMSQIKDAKKYKMMIREKKHEEDNEERIQLLEKFHETLIEITSDINILVVEERESFIKILKTLEFLTAWIPRLIEHERIKQEMFDKVYTILSITFYSLKRILHLNGFIHASYEELDIDKMIDRISKGEL